MFLSLFGSFTQLAHPPAIVARQDPPVYRGKLPSFNLFTVFSPPPRPVAVSPGLPFMFIVPFVDCGSRTTVLWKGGRHGT